MSITRRKFVSLFASMALVLSLVGVAPVAAYADDATTGEIVAHATAITVTTGSSTDLSQYFDPDDSVDGDYHFDYVMSGSGATVNKHSGAFVPTSAGNYTVTVYLLAGAQPDKNSGKPCTGYTVLDQATLSITVATVDGSYGYQGSGQNSILVTDPAVTSVDYDAASGTYVNELSVPSLSEDGNYYLITYKQNAGFKDHDGADSYTALNKGQIVLMNGDGEQVASLGDGTGVLVVDSATHATKTIVLKIKVTDAVSLGNMALVFSPDLRGNNDKALLGSTVEFDF